MSFTREQVDELAGNEPGWVSRIRHRALQRFEDSSLPREKEESWRYTDLNRMGFDLESFSPAPRSNTLPPEASKLIDHEGPRAGYVVQRDSGVVLARLADEFAVSGVVLASLDEAVETHGHLVKPHLFSESRMSDSIFAALHGTRFSGGTFLHVPWGVAVSQPIEVQRWLTSGGGAMFPHTLIVVEEGADVTFFERFRSASLESPGLLVGSTEIIIGRGARVTYVAIQEHGDNVWHFHTQRAALETDSTLRNITVTLGGRFSRTQTECLIRGERTSSEMLGIYFAEGGQHFDHRTLQDHGEGRSTSDLLYKGALKDESRTVYSGLIRVHEGAAKTDAYQANRNLVLSDHAKADSKPELEILNNDVRCTHGSTVGQIDDDELFYIQTRGIDRTEAERLLVHGFFGEVIERVKVEEIRELLRAAVRRKMGE